ncbi:L-alanine-DL-glutamate epimerase [Rhizobium sp. NFR07]|uniref:mandelate racemase/muconate lactonizing enzyme family protein n=1 Tax=Rhizobium sp. NFR07 TaxID=1566262 RepID=UPI0008E4A4D6|nr:enolase C-terminal domain-like protein [Rhizobium sp. NFR07]SFB34279.1 L-alanine-DL-glutamate epimerase [Rhizobium sp. NFR07]
MKVSLHRAMLQYGGGLLLHTASSGPIGGLDTLYLKLERGPHAGIGEVRINIAYLNGISPETCLGQALSVIDGLNWSMEPAAIQAELAGMAGVIAPVRMLVDIALHDLIAREKGITVLELLGGKAGSPLRYATNQTLFISSTERLLAQAETYVNRGFRDLKVRVGGGDFAEDVARLAALRQRFGDAVKLAIDANGSWDGAQATQNLQTLARFGLAYVEQPVAPGDWDMLNRLSEKSSLPLMLDESVAGSSDIDAIVAAGGRLWAHLKLVKLGGLAASLSAATRLAAADIPFMIGQMNEGAVATAAALHLSCATQPRFAELYGADGLENDAAAGLAYRDGHVEGPATTGLGLEFDASKTHLVKELEA